MQNSDLRYRLKTIDIKPQRGWQLWKQEVEAAVTALHEALKKPWPTTEQIYEQVQPGDSDWDDAPIGATFIMHPDVKKSLLPTAQPPEA